MSSRTLKWGVGIGACVAGALQLVRPPLTNPPVTAELTVPANVAAVLRKACYDCHSNETQLRWYDEIVPAYWLVARDVREGRAKLNFSELGGAPQPVQKARLYAAVNQIRLRAMPPKQYTLPHGDAVVTPDELAVLEGYLHPTEEPRPPAPAPSAVPSVPGVPGAALAWVRARAAVAPAPSGLAFAADYADWKPISTTDRFDNDTFRVILANDVAARAISEGKIEPWPDGAALAKVAWAQTRSPEGMVVPGAFKQVELMVKDAHAETSGWRWGRWLGEDLTPYGKDASFVSECTGCHAPMRSNDFVFTMPIAARTGDRWNAAAALPDGLPIAPLGWRVVSTSLDPAGGTMSTVYGDDAVAAHARSGSREAYPAGATFARVTWMRQADAHWFGGRVPGAFRSMEIVTATGDAAERKAFTYAVYEGSPPHLVDVGDEAGARRAAAIAGTAPQ